MVDALVVGVGGVAGGQHGRPVDVRAGAEGVGEEAATHAEGVERGVEGVQRHERPEERLAERTDEGRQRLLQRGGRHVGRDGQRARRVELERDADVREERGRRVERR